MFALTQVITIFVTFLATIVFGVPLSKNGLEKSLPSALIRLPASGVDRIFNGEEAAIGQFPYQISLQLNQFGSEFRRFCGGCIIANRFILTAGHCYDDYGFPELSRYRVVAGAHKLDGSDGIIYNLHRFIVHEHLVINIGQTNVTVKNDIGLIKTETVIEFTELVGPIALDTEFLLGGVPAVVSGWGQSNVSVDRCGFVYRNKYFHTFHRMVLKI